MFVLYFQTKIVFLWSKYIEEMANKDLNRIKLVLVENKRTAKWLADELKKDPATVSKWCTNTSQPSLETLTKIAELLDIDVRTLIVQTKKSRIEIEAEKLLNFPSNM